MFTLIICWGIRFKSVHTTVFLSQLRPFAYAQMLVAGPPIFMCASKNSLAIFSVISAWNVPLWRPFFCIIVLDGGVRDGQWEEFLVMSSMQNALGVNGQWGIPGGAVDAKCARRGRGCARGWWIIVWRACKIWMGQHTGVASASNAVYYGCY